MRHAVPIPIPIIPIPIPIHSTHSITAYATSLSTSQTREP